MPIVRLIYVTVNPNQAAAAEQVWKAQCASLMIQQPGCLSEKMLKCLDGSGEYISYSEWESQEQIDAYRKSEAHERIKEHTRKLRGDRPVVEFHGLTLVAPLTRFVGRNPPTSVGRSRLRTAKAEAYPPSPRLRTTLFAFIHGLTPVAFCEGG